MQIASITKRVKRTENITNDELQFQIKINIEIKSLVNFTNCYASQGSQEAQRERDKRKNKYGKIITQRQSDR